MRAGAHPGQLSHFLSPDFVTRMALPELTDILTSIEQNRTKKDFPHVDEKIRSSQGFVHDFDMPPCPSC
jgi:hypothetical protein